MSNAADRPEVGACLPSLAEPVPGTTFAVGTFGALAEFVHEPGETVELSGPAPHRQVVSAHGALRLDLTDPALTARAWQRPTGSGASWTHAVALCLPEGRAAGPARPTLTVLGPDEDAPRPADRRAVLVDLGLGVAHLEACVRTADPTLLARLRAAEGTRFGADPELVGALVEAGPHRVFRTAACRAEVYSPIPPPTGTSPAGPHTHLLPALLAHRRTHAATDPIEPGTVPVLWIFPPHPCRDAMGRERPFDPALAAGFEPLLRAYGDPAEVGAYADVLGAIRAGERARTPPPELSRAGRRGWEVALRLLEAAGETGPTWRSWRAAAPRTGEDADYHQSH